MWQELNHWLRILKTIRAEGSSTALGDDFGSDDDEPTTAGVSATALATSSNFGSMTLAPSSSGSVGRSPAISPAAISADGDGDDDDDDDGNMTDVPLGAPACHRSAAVLASGGR